MRGRARLLLIAPSRGLGGGIERVAVGIEGAWRGEVRRLDLRTGGVDKRSSASNLQRITFALEVVTTAIRMRPQVVIALNVNLLIVAYVAARACGAQVALFAHGIEVWGQPGRMRRRLINRTDRVLAPSSFTADVLSRRTGRAAGGIAVIPLAVDHQLAAAAVVSPSRGFQPASFLTVARIDTADRYKGHHEVARAFSQVLVAEPEARWVIVGGGDDVDQLIAACEHERVWHAVDLRGRVNEQSLIQAYREASFLVLPSVADPDTTPPQGEGFGLVYAEAAAFGLPSVASTAGGGCLDFVENEITGLTVPPNSPNALSKAILRLIREPELRERLGAAAKLRLHERHSEARFVAAMLRSLTG